MTGQMGDEQLDREIRTFLAWQAEDVVGVPTATDMAIRIGSRAASRTIGLRPPPLLAWVLVAGLLLLAMVAAAVIGALSNRAVDPPMPISYEAVFLRLEVVDGSSEVVAVGVDPEGHQREIARLPHAWTTYSIGDQNYLAPTGAVSPGGLLAIPSSRDGGLMHWEIFDLHHPQAEPIVIAGIEQDVEQIQASPYFRLDMRASVFWGPGERVAIPWYKRLAEGLDWHLSFVDGPTGAATAVDVPGGSRVLPQWATDGSGVFLSGPTLADTRPLGILRPDGTVADATSAVAVSSCRTRDQSGAEISVVDGRVVRRNVDGSREDLSSPGGVGFACLAPDDSMIVHNIDIGDGQGTATASSPLGGLIIPEAGARFAIDGTFAGWLEVDR